LNRDSAQVARVRGIAARLIPQTKGFRADAPGWNWEVNVITSKQVNAWVMPGGKIAFYTGLIEQLQTTDDEIAAVMGHEMAHALREHGRERASQAVAQGIGLVVVGTALGMGESAMDLTQLVLDLTFNLPNSRTNETEADRIGVEIAARGGFDPRAAITLWEKMQKNAKGQPPQFLSTHPSHNTRIGDLRVHTAKVLPLYEAARAKR
ncbi:MAG: M48 family metallopeptidase, partial [Betaproteobacteria bacterium]|nr:M48 family metallopeptidase [Betaproteobacteria bacterium]